MADEGDVEAVAEAVTEVADPQTAPDPVDGADNDAGNVDTTVENVGADNVATEDAPINPEIVTSDDGPVQQNQLSQPENAENASDHESIKSRKSQDDGESKGVPATPQSQKQIRLQPKPSKSENYNIRVSYVPSKGGFYDYEFDPDRFLSRLDHDATFQKAMQVQPSEESIYTNEKYADPLVDPYKKAIEYLERHSIVQIFQSLTSSVVYTMPDDPLAVMVDHLQILKSNPDRLIDFYRLPDSASDLELEVEQNEAGQIETKSDQ